MDNKRELTGEWYLKQQLFNYTIMVEVEIEKWDDPSYGNGGAGYVPKITRYERATHADLIALPIEIDFI